MSVAPDWAFAHLGLRPDADIHAVKRAYAQLLRQTRPDEDPAGFQVLHTHYQSALAYLAWRAQAVSDTTTTGGTESIATAATTSNSAIPQPAASTNDDLAVNATNVSATVPTAIAPPTSELQQAFDFETFYAALLGETAKRDPSNLITWLQAQPALWSFELKSEVGVRTLQQLFHQVPPMDVEQFDMLLAFFDLDHVFAVRDPLAIENLRDAMAVRQELLDDENTASLELRMRRVGNFHGSDTARIVRGLRRPWAFSSGFFEALMPGKASEMARFVRVASRGHLGLLSPPIDPRWPTFWINAAGTGKLTWLYTSIGLARCALATLFLLALSIVGSFAGNAPPEIWPGAGNVLMFGLATGICWLGYIVLRCAVAWQALPQVDDAGWPKWLRMFFLPLLCCACGLLVEALRVAASGWVVFTACIACGATFWIALRRYRIRANSKAMNLDLRVIIFLLIFVGTLVTTLIDEYQHGHAGDSDGFVTRLCYVVISLSLLIWAADLWKQRRRLIQPPSFAP